MKSRKRKQKEFLPADISIVSVGFGVTKDYVRAVIRGDRPSENIMKALRTTKEAREKLTTRIAKKY
jgi:hypothetical protein